MRAKEIIDLHVHSTASDGSLTPAEVAALAAKRGLAAFSLTDHDTVAGVKEAAAAAADFGLEFLPGMELSVFFASRQLHIICLNFDVESVFFRELTNMIDTEPEVMADQALPLVNAAGGLTSLAHFHKQLGLKGLCRQAQEELISQLISHGLKGMELYYPSYTAEDAAFAGYIIDKYGLIATGGSDFHGANRPGIELGTGADNNIHIPYSIFKHIKELTQSNKNS